MDSELEKKTSLKLQAVSPVTVDVVAGVTMKLPDISDEQFQQLILKLLEKYSVAQLADELMVSRPTIDRWSRGVNLAHRYMRHSILRYATMKL